MVVVVVVVVVVVGIEEMDAGPVRFRGTRLVLVALEDEGQAGTKQRRRQDEAQGDAEKVW